MVSKTKLMDLSLVQISSSLLETQIKEQVRIQIMECGSSVREIVTFFLWFDILDENGLPFIEKTANRLTPESMFYGLEKTAQRLWRKRLTV